MRVALSLLLATAMLMGAVPSALAQSQSSRQARDYAIDQQTRDVGTIPSQVPLTVNYTIGNTGTRPLIITRVETNCGCMTAEFTKEPITPGRTATIKVIFNAASPGPFYKLVTVNSNASDPVILLRLRGRVE